MFEYNSTWILWHSDLQESILFQVELIDSDQAALTLKCENPTWANRVGGNLEISGFSPGSVTSAQSYLTF